MSVEMSDNRTRNSRGPSTAPCGTPLGTEPLFLTPPGRRTQFFLSEKVEEPFSQIPSDTQLFQYLQKYIMIYFIT